MKNVIKELLLGLVEVFTETIVSDMGLGLLLGLLGVSILLVPMSTGDKPIAMIIIGIVLILISIILIGKRIKTQLRNKEENDK